MSGLKVGDQIIRKNGVDTDRVATVLGFKAGRISYRYVSGQCGSVRADCFHIYFSVKTRAEEGPTKGHCEGNGGLRGHSCGELFPVVLYQRGNPHREPLTHWLRMPNGQDIGPFWSWDAASAVARMWKEEQ